MTAVDEVMSRFNYEWLSRALVVFFAFIPFFAVRELRRVLGEGVIRKFFFERRSATEAGCDPPLMSNHELATGDRRSTSTWFMAFAVLTLVLSLGLQVASEFAPDADSERPARLRPLLLSLVADARAAEGNAQETELAAGETELAKESQNPVADLISLPLQYNLGFNVGPYDRAQSVLNIQPVIPVRLTEDWNLITRTILPLIKQPVLTPEVTQVQTPAGVQTSVTYPDESDSGMGDLNLSLFLSPAEPGKLIWGIGPALSFPTASEEQLGTGKSSASAPVGSC